MRFKNERAKEIVEMLHNDYKVGYRDLARYIGVMEYMPFRWKNLESFPNEENMAKLEDMVLRLAGHKVRYKGQAIDILKGE
jgi:hypothetical protein